MTRLDAARACAQVADGFSDLPASYTQPVVAEPQPIAQAAASYGYGAPQAQPADQETVLPWT